MEGLNLNDILSEEQRANLFKSPDEVGDGQDAQPEGKDPDGEGSAGKENDTAEGEDGNPVRPEDLFGGPESVGGKNDDKDKEGAQGKPADASPKQNVYSSIARVLVDEGIFQSLDADEAGKVETPEGFADMFEREIRSRLDERQRRIDEALGLGVDPDLVREYEQSLKQLDSITDVMVRSESQQGESVRRMLIYNDLLHHGFSKERAKKEMEKSFKAGTDVEDAREALKSNRDWFRKAYDDEVGKAREEEEARHKATEKEADELRRDIVENEEVIKGLKVDKATRQRVFDNISKEVWTEPESGKRFTALQKYEFQHRREFLKYMGVFFTLTDGFKNIDRLVKDGMREERKSGFRQLENMLSGGKPGGEMSLMGGLGGDGKGGGLLPDGWKFSDR